MSNFCILRAEKLKTIQNVAASLDHHLRTRDTPNADLDRIENNYYHPNKYESQTDNKHIENNDPAKREAMKRKALVNFKSKLPDKVRKNAVLAVELLMTLSPEAAQQPNFNANEFCDCASNWAHQKFGNENVYFIAYHLDEKTPHVSIQLVPKDDKGKLNCRYYLGGRKKLRELQDSFAEEMGKYFGLERGVKGSKAKHQKVKRFYNAINRQQETEKDIVTQLHEDVPEMTLFERAFAPDKYRARVEEKVNQTLNDTAENYSAQLAEAERLRAAQESVEREHRLIQATLARDRRQLEEEYEKKLDEKLQEQKDTWADEKKQLNDKIEKAIQQRYDCLFKTGSLKIDDELFTCYGNDFTLDENGNAQKIHGGIAHYAKELHRILNSDKEWFANAYGAMEATQTQTLKDAITVMQRGDMFRIGDIFEPAWYEIREDKVGQYAVLTDGKKTSTNLGLLDFLKTEFEADTMKTGAKRRVHSIEIGFKEDTGSIELMENYSKDDLRQDTENQRELVLKLTPERLQRERERQQEKTFGG